MTGRKAARIDVNQPTIVEALEAVGASVQSLAGIGKGCPDLLVCYGGDCYLLEVKTRYGRANQLTRSLNADQEKWRRDWCGPVHIVSTVKEALDVIGLEWMANE